MGETSIQWTQRQRPDGSWMPGYTFNPWWGCVKISPACDHCYAEKLAHRFGLALWGPHAPRRMFGEAHWREPLKWDRRAREAGERHLVFCASMSDIFEDYKTEPELGRLLDVERARLFRLITQTSALDWLLLTKRPGNVVRMVPPGWRDGFPPNAHLGCTVENQENLDRRGPLALACPARMHFLSYEPALDDLDLAPYLGPGGFSWVIVGGESGGKARPMLLRRIERTIESCRAAGAAVFVKQLGSHPLDGDLVRVRIGDRSGGKVDEWPEHLRVREHPPIT